MDSLSFSRALASVGATVRLSSFSGSSSSGRGVSSGCLRFSKASKSTGLMFSSILGAGFSGSTGFSFECGALEHPGMLRNWLKSVDFLLQQDHPLRASWKTGTPGWCWQASVNPKALNNTQFPFLTSLSLSKRPTYHRCSWRDRTFDHNLCCSTEAGQLRTFLAVGD